MENYRDELIKIFEEANKRFREKNKKLFLIKANERTFCGALMLELKEVLKHTIFKDYYVDVEYNRNGENIKKIHETSITSDLIVHSRKEKILDNLITIEIKKSHVSSKFKDKDKERLKFLTKSCDFKYQLGIYYEINFSKQEPYIEYYEDGEKINYLESHKHSFIKV